MGGDQGRDKIIKTESRTTSPHRMVSGYVTGFQAKQNKPIMFSINTGTEVVSFAGIRPKDAFLYVGGGDPNHSAATSCIDVYSVVLAAFQRNLPVQIIYDETERVQQIPSFQFSPELIPQGVGEMRDARIVTCSTSPVALRLPLFASVSLPQATPQQMPQMPQGAMMGGVMPQKMGGGMM